MSSIQSPHHSPRSASDAAKRPIHILASKKPNVASSTPVILLNRPPPATNNSLQEDGSNGGAQELVESSSSPLTSTSVQGPAAGLAKLASLDISSDLPRDVDTSPAASAAAAPPHVDPLDHTLVDALRSSRDRIFLLRQEQEMHDFVSDASRQEMSLPLMNSYQRLLVHRCAETFKLERDVDPETKAVSLKKTASTRIPPMRLIQVYNQQQAALKPTDISPFAVLNRSANASVAASQCPSPTMRSGAGSPSLEQSEASSTAASTTDAPQPKTAFRIMRRDPSLGSGKSAHRATSSDTGSTSEPRPKARKDMTIEEREAAYREARERIFGPTTTDSDAPSSSGTTGTTGTTAKVKDHRTTSGGSSSNGSNSLSGGPDGGVASPSTTASHTGSQEPSWMAQQIDHNGHATAASLPQPADGLLGSVAPQQWAAGPGFQPTYHLNAGAPIFQSSQAPLQGGYATPTSLPPHASLPPRWPPYAMDGGFAPPGQGYHVQQPHDQGQQGQPLPQNAAANGIYQWQMHPQLLREHALPVGSPVNSFTRLSNGSMSNLSNCDAFSPFPPTPSATSSVGIPSPAPSVAGSSASAGGIGSRTTGRRDRTNRINIRGSAAMPGLEERRMPSITRRDSSTSGAGTECSSAGAGSAMGPPSSTGGADSEADFAGPMSTAFTTARAHNWLQGQQQQQDQQQHQGRQGAGLGTPSSSSDASLSPAAQKPCASPVSPLPRSDSQSPVAGRTAGLPMEDMTGVTRPQGGGRLNVGDRTLFDPNAARRGPPSSSTSSASATPASGVSSPVVLSVGHQGRYGPQQAIHSQQQPQQFQQIAQQQHLQPQQQPALQGGSMPVQPMNGMGPQGQLQYQPLPQQQQQQQGQAQVPMMMTMMMMVPATHTQQPQQQQPLWVPVWQPQPQGQGQHPAQMVMPHGQMMQNVPVPPAGQFIPQQQQQQALHSQPFQGMSNGGQHHVGAPFVGSGPQFGPVPGQRQQYQQMSQAAGVGQQHGRTLRMGAMRPAQGKQAARGVVDRGAAGVARSTASGAVVRRKSSEGSAVSPSTTPSLPAAVASLPARPDWVLKGGSEAYGSGSGSSSSGKNGSPSKIGTRKEEDDEGDRTGGQSTPRSLSRSPSSMSGESRGSGCRSRSRTHSRSASIVSMHSSRSSSLGPSASASNIGDVECEDEERVNVNNETMGPDGAVDV